MDSEIYAIALGQSVLIGIMLLVNPERGPVHAYLAAILLVLGGLFSIVVLKQYQPPQWVGNLDVVLGAALVPLLLLNAHISTGSPAPNERRVAIQVGVPIVLGCVGALYDPERARVFMLLALSSSIVVVLIRLSRFVRQFDNEHADSGLIRMAWLRNAHGVVAVIIGAALVQHAVEGTALSGLNNVLIFGIPIGLILLNSYIALNLMQVRPIHVQTLTRTSAEKRKDQLGPRELLEVQQRLEKIMREEHLYRDSALQLQTLSERVGIAPHSVTEGIRRGLAANFFDFVNRYRIDEARRLLDAGDMTVTDVMYRAGFSSKSSFYKEFRKRTGRAPRQVAKSGPSG